MLYNIPYYPFPTGYINATGYINLDMNKLKNFDFISINNNEIFYHDNSNEFGPPDFFDSFDSFVNIINSNQNIYGVNLVTGANFISIKSILPGESGNNILLRSSNTGIIFNSNSLIGGINLYSILKKPRYPLNRKNFDLVSPPFTGIFYNKFYLTGFYTGVSEGAYLTGNINSFRNSRYFYNIWNISTGFVNVLNKVDFKLSNYISGNSYFKTNDQILNTKSPIEVQVFYENNLSLSNNIDIAEIIIKDLNAPQSRLSGIIFRITGVT